MNKNVTIPYKGVYLFQPPKRTPQEQAEALKRSDKMIEETKLRFGIK
jgi:hypothetical protein